MLAALAATGFGSSTPSQAVGEDPQQASKEAPPTDSTTAAAPSSSGPTASAGRRRSLRLSAKHTGPTGVPEGDQSVGNAVAHDPPAESSTIDGPHSTAPATVDGLNIDDNAVDSTVPTDFHADEVDEEVWHSYDRQT
jgi:hypothetical protein